MIAVATLLASIALLTATGWWLSRWADHSWDRHWASISTMIACECGDPYEITWSHNPRHCTPKATVR